MRTLSIILLAIFLCLPAATCAKTKKAKFQNRTSLIIREYCDSSGVQIRYGLKQKKKTLLAPQYRLRFNENVRIFVFYTEQEIYIVDEFGKTLYSKTVDEVWRGAEVLIEPVREREDVQCYEVNMFFWDNDLIMQKFGTFFYSDGHLYQILTAPKIIRLN